MNDLKQIKKADKKILADSNGNLIIDDYLKFVKGDKEAVKKILAEIFDVDILAAVLEYIAMRSEELNDKVGERSLKQFLKKLDGICDLQGIKWPWETRKQVQLMMIQKAISSKWLSVFPLAQSELDLILKSDSSSPFDFDIEEVKKKINNFD